MNELQIFTNGEFGELGVIDEDGKLYFPATRSAEILGYKNPEKAIRNHCKGVRETFTMVQTGIKADGSLALRETTIKVISEGDLYRLIVRSKLLAAQRFETWLFDEVLPSINKYKMYTIDELLKNPDVAIAALKRFKAERENVKSSGDAGISQK